ncbi:hypothetical protein O9929_18675 [Vibrio lentus]|nr:hypothetical protein [Vibrio lentus]
MSATNLGESGSGVQMPNFLSLKVQEKEGDPSLLFSAVALLNLRNHSAENNGDASAIDAPVYVMI